MRNVEIILPEPEGVPCESDAHSRGGRASPGRAYSGRTDCRSPL